jgi:hypothetical protein
VRSSDRFRTKETFGQAHVRGQETTAMNILA